MTNISTFLIRIVDLFGDEFKHDNFITDLNHLRRLLHCPFRPDYSHKSCFEGIPFTSEGSPINWD